MFEKDVELSVVVPIFNEELIIPQLVQRLIAVLGPLCKTHEIILVDDGSKDSSFLLLQELHRKHKGIIKVVKLSRNFGHQLAISAGIKCSLGKAVVIMDGDLQDPPETIAEFFGKWKEGYDVVYGVRKERKGETFFKKITAKIFYKLIRAATSIDIPENAGDFYLLSRPVVDVLNSMGERHRFLRGMVAWVGFHRGEVDYIRDARFAGKTKFTFWKMVKFSFDAATSFSFAPLRMISWAGAFISMMAFFYILFIFYQKFFTNQTITGWPSIMVAVLFIGGIQLLAIGLIGEYIARIGDDVKRRPLYAVSKRLE